MRLAHAESSQIPRVAYISLASGPGPNHAAFLKELKVQGYVQDHNISIDWRWLNQRYDKLADTIDALAKSDVRALIVQTQAVAVAAQRAIRSTPIVFVGVRDPVLAGLVTSMNHPGGNITGSTLAPTWELAAKQVELLRDINAKASAVGVFWNPNVGAQAQAIKSIATATAPLGIRLIPRGVSAKGDIERAFEDLSSDHVDGIITLVDSFSYENRSLIANLAKEKKIITISETREYVEAGGLFSYGIIYQQMYAEAARLLARILRGESPALLPVVEASRFELVVNLTTARALGINLPTQLMGRADEIID
jgi:putative tryptophan/tyrosine transport system substrate-binding protein